MGSHLISSALTACYQISDKQLLDHRLVNLNCRMQTSYQIKHPQ
jgi:hypothetical protein